MQHDLKTYEIKPWQPWYSFIVPVQYVAAR